MKFGAQFTYLALLVGTSAAQLPGHLGLPTTSKRSPPSVVERDVATITSVVATVDAGIKNLDTAVKGFSASNSGSVATLNSAAKSLVDSINAGTSSVQGTANISLQDALSLQTFVQSLGGDGSSLVNDLAAQKPQFEQAGLCAVVLQQAVQVSDASTGLINAIVSKVPASAQSIAASMAAGFTNTLAQSQATFANGNCTNAAGAGAGSTIGGSNSSVTTTATGSKSSVTAGAAINAVAGSVGALAMAVAVAML